MSILVLEEWLRTGCQVITNKKDDQCVEIDDVSEQITITCGTPLSSVLGPNYLYFI